MFELMTCFAAVTAAMCDTKTSLRWEPKLGRHMVRLVPFSGETTAVVLTRQHYVGSRGEPSFSVVASPKGSPDPFWDFANAMRRAVPEALNKRLFAAFGLSRTRALIQIAVGDADSTLIWNANQDVVKLLGAIEEQLEGEGTGENLFDFPLTVEVGESRASFGDKPVHSFTITAARRPAPRPSVRARTFGELLTTAPPRADSTEAREKLRIYIERVVVPACSAEGVSTEWLTPWLAEVVPF